MRIALQMRADALASFPKLKDTDWAYLAGLFDGEGSVHLSRGRNRSGHTRTFGLMVTAVCGCDIKAIRGVAVLLQCPVPKELMNGYGNKRPGTRIRFRSGKALWFLEGVRPYLRMRCKQADLAIQFQRTKTYKGGRITDKRSAYEYSAKAKLTKLNQRGVITCQSER
jgi:hypothetical protein